MKKSRRLILRTVFMTGLSTLGPAPAQEWESDVPATPNVIDAARTTPEKAADASASVTRVAAAGTNVLRMNFRGAPLNLVLDYLSDAAGFIINKETEVRGNVQVWSKDPFTREEAVELLNSALRKNGYAVIRHGRILTIQSLDSAKTSDLEVSSSNDPGTVQKSDEVVTQIIPVRYASASQLINNLQVLLPSSASLSVNESANSLILVATKTDIRRMLRIITALDTAIASVASIKVLPLRYADAKQLATSISQLFASPGSNRGAGAMNARAQLFNLPGGGGFGPPGSGEVPDASASSEGSGGTSAAAKVVVVADERSNSLIVSSSEGLLAMITNMVRQIDQPVTDTTELRVFPLRNADATELAEQLAQLFPEDSKSNSDQNQMPFRFGGGPPAPDGGAGGGSFGAGSGDDQSSSSARLRKKGQVLAVADPRTASLLVSAARTLMPEIAKLIAELDASSARKEIVKVYELQNANPQDVNQVLQALFNRNSTMQNNSSRSSLLGDSNPLTTRQTQQQGGTTTGSSGLGNSGSRGGSNGP